MKEKICFFTDTKVADEKSIECGSAAEVLAIFAKRLLSLKAVAREQPIIANMPLGELTRFTFNTCFCYGLCTVSAREL